MATYTEKPESNMVWAILTTLFCCLPLGILSIYYASQVNKLYKNGDDVGALFASERSKEFSKWGMIISVTYAVIHVIAKIAGII